MLEDLSFLTPTFEAEFLRLYDENEEFRKAISDGRDLNDYQHEVDAKLKELEQQTILEYTKNYKNLKLLHDDVSKCEEVLNKLDDSLGRSLADISRISHDIAVLQSDSKRTMIKLKNRKQAKELVSSFVDGIILSPEDIDILINYDIDSDQTTFFKSLAEFSRKLQGLRNPEEEWKNVPSYKEVVPELEKLRQTVVVRIRETIYVKFNQLRKPKTNLQIIQQSALIPLRPLIKFLEDFENIVYNDLLGYYTMMMASFFAGQFQFYHEKRLESLKSFESSCFTIFGTSSTYSSGTAGKLADITSKISSFGSFISQRSFQLNTEKRNSLIDPPWTREKLLVDLESASPSVKGEVYYEEIYWSVLKLLIDSAYTEFRFLQAFFFSTLETNLDDKGGLMSTFQTIIEKTLVYVDTHVQQYVETCEDSSQILLLIRLCEHFRCCRLKKEIDSPRLDAFFSQQLVCFWSRLYILVDQIKTELLPCSLGLFDAVNSVEKLGFVDRFCEVIYSLSSARHRGCIRDEYLLNVLNDLFSRFRGFFFDLSNLKVPGSVEERHAFLVINFDYLITLFLQHQISIEQREPYESELKVLLTRFVDCHVASHFPYLTTISESESDFNNFEAVLVSFEKGWKQEMGLIRDEVPRHLPGLKNTNEIIKQTLTKVLLSYTSVQKTMTHNLSADDRSKLEKHLVSPPNILQEIMSLSSG